MDRDAVSDILEYMLSEDVGVGDVTSSLTPNKKVKAVITTSSPGYVSGVAEALLLFKKHNISAKPHVRDGGRVRRGQRVLTLYGMSHDILPLERTALNILSRMSGITTTTRKYVDVLRRIRSKAVIAATRKTTPGLMRLEKKAVRLGGGITHRMGLYDMILIKDNHLTLFGGDVKAAVYAAKKAKGKLKVEVEVESVADALAAAESGADIIMFDNMRPAQIQSAVDLLKRRRLRSKVLLEVSGGVTLRNLTYYGKLDVDWISTGKLTTAAPWLDFRLHIV